MMVYQPGPIDGRHSVALYERRINGERDPRRARHHRMVVCGECGADLVAAFMVTHLHTHNGRLGHFRAIPHPLPLPALREYRVIFLHTATAIDSLVEGYPGRANSCNNFCLYFMNRHVEENNVVLNEGPDPDPQCK